LNRGRAVREGLLETDAGTATAFCWETKGVRLRLISTLSNPSEQALSCEAKEPEVLSAAHPASPYALGYFFSSRTYPWKWYLRSTFDHTRNVC